MVSEYIISKLYMVVVTIVTIQFKSYIIYTRVAVHKSECQQLEAFILHATK